MARTIPNLLTLLNLFCGSSAVVCLFIGQIEWTLVFLLASLVADVLDGLAARSLNMSSPLGKELDSLADMVSFGFLPGAVLFYLLFIGCKFQYSLWAALPAFLITIASALRLARFNLDSRQEFIFYGLPTPAATVFIGGLLLMHWRQHPWVEWLPCQPYFIYAIIVIIAFLLNANLKLFSAKSGSGQAGLRLPITFFVVFLILLIIVKEAAFSVIVVLYVLTGFMNRLFKFY
jgi:CDP-diacylglycerol--serine O-phosphatidyltransferase